MYESWMRRRIGLDELEELLGLPFGFADDEDVGEDLVVTLVQLVEEHVDSIVRSDRVAKYTAGSAIDAGRGGGDGARRGIEVVHVGSASRDLDARRSARLAARRRRRRTRR